VGGRPSLSLLRSSWSCLPTGCERRALAAPLLLLTASSWTDVRRGGLCRAAAALPDGRAIAGARLWMSVTCPPPAR
jgi:hypothetical protein